MSVYSNLTEQDLDNLRKLANQQKEQRALKIKNRILKQTHDVKLSEALNPVTKKLDESTSKIGDAIKESTQNLGNVIKETTPQLAIENTPIHQPIEDNEGRIYDVKLENTLNKKVDNTGFFKTHYDRQRGWMLNNLPVKSCGGTEVEIKDNKNNITPGLQKVFTDKTYKTAKSMNDNDKKVFGDILIKTGYYNRIPSKGRMSGRDKYIQNDLDNDVARILNLDIKPKLKRKGIEKIIIPSNVIDIYIRLEILLGLKLSGHSDTLTEGSNLIDELYKRGEIQNKHQYRNALNKFQTL